MSGWQASYQDPLRWKAPHSSKESCCTGAPSVEAIENDLCSAKLVVMHKPTHNLALEKTGQYPFSSHLSGKRRLWEIRVQMRFKQVPKSQLFVGLELGKFVALSTITKQVQKALVGACKGIVGDCYHSNGDNPTRASGEIEPPTFVMPLWAFDQFEVSEPGREPDLASDLTGRGLLRSDSVKAYIRSLKGEINSFSTDKVYTFCLWGISRYLDFMNWEVIDLLPGMKLDFNKLCGSPPVTIAIYDIPDLENSADQRHLKSRKRYFFNVAAWSTTKPPKAEVLDALTVVAEPEEDDPAMTAIDLANLDLLGETLAKQSEAQSVDLLGDLFGEQTPKTAAAPGGGAAAGATGGYASGSVDLLGLDM